MSAHANLVAIAIALGIWILPGLLSYGIFRPHADTLKQKVLLNLAGFPVIFAMLGPMIYGEGPNMIPFYFVRWGIYFALTALLFHYAERLLGIGDA